MRTISRLLDDVIGASYRDAISFHGDLGLSIGAWRARVLGILDKCNKHPDDCSAADFAERLHNRDLYLATCCAAGVEPGWQRFQSLYQKYVQELVRCLCPRTLQATDVGEGMLVDLFLPDRSGQSRIGSYDGRSSLATWLHVIVTHRIANERVRKWNTLERPGDIPDVPDARAMGELEASMRAARYGPAIEESLRKACEALNPHERQMLLWRYQRGLLLEQMARLLSVHPSTVFRQLERLQQRLRSHVVSTLTTTYGFAEDTIAECLNEVLERGTSSISLLRLIDDGTAQSPYRAATEESRHIA
jgi:RNA polymerase sigma-70 factor